MKPRSIDKNYNAIEKCLQILSMYSLDKTQFSIKEICTQLNFNVSTAYRILSTLEEYGYVSRLKNKDYVLELKSKKRYSQKQIKDLEKRKSELLAIDDINIAARDGEIEGIDLAIKDIKTLEGKLDKAEEILDISLEKMPVNKFGHYSMLISYIDLYYALDKKEKAQKLITELKKPLQENLVYFSQYEESNIDVVFDQIERNFLMYDQIVKSTIRFDDEEYAKKIKNEYVLFLKLFDFLMTDEE